MREHDRPPRYEPRVLWSVASIFDAAGPTEVRLPRNHFRNGEDGDYVLTHAIVAPVGVMARQGNVSAIGANGSLLQHAKLLVKHPQRRRQSRLLSPALLGRAEPAGAQRAGTASSLFGTMCWMFEEDIRIAPMGNIYMRMTGVRRPKTFPATPPAMTATPCFFQRDPIGARVGATKELPYQFVNGLPGVTAAEATLLDLSTQQDTTNQVGAAWGKRDLQRGATWIVPNGDRLNPPELAAFSYLEGMSLLIDQIDVDNTTVGAQENEMAHNACAWSVQLTASEDIGAVSGTPWWRGFCPIVLTMPTINGAGIVYRLDDPIRLGRGDCLDITTEIGDADFPAQTIGVSFLGYTEMARG